ncbi:hypothetical protein TNCV_1346481 [Trichonephila clavipes]|nr:hypothetical protein TNCV_1346481 [Trichonephila clavipes]
MQLNVFTQERSTPNWHDQLRQNWPHGYGSNSRAIGDGSHNFEPLSIDEDDTHHNMPMEGLFKTDIVNVHQPPLHGGSSVAPEIDP